MFTTKMNPWVWFYLKNYVYCLEKQSMYKVACEAVYCVCAFQSYLKQ